MATHTTNYNLTKPTFSELADVRAINGNMDIIDDVMNASQNSIAPPYDSTESYSEGDMVMYELYLYKCLEETTGTWDATKWERAYSASSGAGIVYPQDATKYLNGMGQWAVPAGSGVNYSTTEQVIGTWIDGSIIYRRTFEFSSPVSVGDSWVNTPIDSTGIDKIIRSVGYHSDGTCYPDICADPTRNNHTVVGLEGYSQGTVSILVLEYTKL
jgi:hypothetical protein